MSEEIENSVDRAETLRGDIRDQILHYVQSHMPDAWAGMNEKMQTSFANAIEEVAEGLIYSAIGIIHAEGAPSMRMIVGKVAFGKGISATMTAAKTEENRHLLADLADGAEVLLRMENVNRYLGERGPADVDPDQMDLEAEAKKKAAADNAQADETPADDAPAKKPAKKRAPAKRKSTKKTAPAKAADKETEAE